MFDCSVENISGAFLFAAAMFSMKAVLPIAGLAATIIKSAEIA